MKLNKCLKNDEQAFKGIEGVAYKTDYKERKAIEHIDIGL